MLHIIVTIALAVVLSTHSIAKDNTDDGAALDKAIAQARADYAKDKRSIVQEAMSMTPNEAEQFWPLYEQYDAELTKANDERTRLAKTYVDSYYSMNNAQAESFAQRYFAWEERRTNLRKAYFDKFAAATSPATALKFFQLEHRLDVLVDLVIASQLPALFVKVP